MKAKKGIFFMLDALLGASIVIIGIILLNVLYINDPPTTNLNIIGEDILDTLETITLQDFKVYDSSMINNLVNDGNITHLNNSLLLQIGEFWSEDKIGLARNFTKNVTDKIIPAQLGFALYIDGELIYERQIDKTDYLVVSKKIISGLSKFTPLRGFISKLRLSSINYKKGTSLIYFGGFVGQGNITTIMNDIPEASNITKLYMELSTPANFSLKINEIFCGNYTAGGYILGSSRYNIIKCNSSLISNATNNFTIFFPDAEFNESFIGGGVIVAKYNTNTLSKPSVYGSKKKYLPGIQGPINIYSSFDVPGKLNSLEMFIHFKNQYAWYVNVGNDTVFDKTNLSEKTFFVNNTYLSSILNYSSFENQTVPLRLGLVNATYTSNGEGLEAVIVTDVSGSMEYNIGSGDISTYSSTVFRLDNKTYCGSRYIFDASSGAPRIEYAINASKAFAEVILNSSKNRIGIVEYSADGGNMRNFLTDLEVNIYAGSPGGCYPERYGIGWMESYFDDNDWDNITLPDNSFGCDQCMRFYRKEFELDKIDFKVLRLGRGNDNGIICYLNGYEIIDDINSRSQYYYNYIPLSTLNIGTNILACGVRDGTGGEYYNILLRNEFGYIIPPNDNWKYLHLASCGGSTNNPKYMRTYENMDVPITIYATVFNPGDDISRTFNVSFYNVSIDPLNKIGSVAIEGIQGWSYKTAKIITDQYLTGDVTYLAEIDLNGITDPDMTNNDDSETISASTPTVPDISLKDLSYTPGFCVYGKGLSLILNASFINLGTDIVTDFNITFQYYNYTLSSWIDYGVTNVPGLNQGQSSYAEYPLTLNLFNSTPIRAFADKEDSLIEVYSFNNLYVTDLESRGADLIINTFEILPTKHSCSQGNLNINLIANVTSLYCNMTTPINLTFYYGQYLYNQDPPINIVKNIKSLNKSQIVTYNQSLSITTTNGNSYTYGTYIDYPPHYKGLFLEVNDANNLKHETLTVGTDIYFSNFIVTPKNTSYGNTINYEINATVKNTYCDSNNYNSTFSVRFYNYSYYEPISYDSQIHMETINLPANSEVNISFIWNAGLLTSNKLIGIIDREYLIPELTEANNVAEEDIFICGDGTCNNDETWLTCSDECFPVDPTGLVLLMHMNESAGSGTIIDYSGLGNNGTPSAGLDSNDYNQPGQFGDAIRFNANGEYIQVTDDDSLGASGLNELTISLWIYTTYGSDYLRLLGTTDNYNGDGYNIYLRGGQNNYEYAFDIDGEYVRAGNILTSQWHHVAGTYDGHIMRLYVNGVEIGTNSAPEGPINPNSGGSLRIGEITNFGSGYNFRGSVDELLIFNRSLSASEIFDLYNMSTGFFEFDVGDYKFWDYLSLIPAARAYEGISSSCDAHQYNSVSFFPNEANIPRVMNLTDDYNSIIDYIDLTETWWGTCICCGINRAVQMLQESPFITTKSILVMSDGEANQACPGMDPTPNHDGDWDTTNDPQDQAIEAACIAGRNNITVHAICMGNGCLNQTMIDIAACGGGEFIQTDMENLVEKYQDIADRMLNASFFQQTIAQAEYQNTILYPDSYIEINFTPNYPKRETGDIEVTLETDKFTNCTPHIQLPNSENFVIREANVLSYSAQHWTSFLSVNNDVIFNLTDYNYDYLNLGDPFSIYVPGKKLYLDGTNNILNLFTADAPTNTTNCSINNSMIYTSYIKGSFNSELGTIADGCNWTIEFNDGTTNVYQFPTGYSGSNICSFTSTSVSYNINDSIDLAIYELLDLFDFDDDNISDINFNENGIEVSSILYNDVPSMWGPAIAEVYVWN